MSYTVSLDGLGPLRLNETDPVRSVLQNVFVILSTWKGSVPLYREFGVSSALQHKPIPVAKAMMHAEIREVVEKFEPRVEVVGVAFNSGANGLIPVVEVNILE